MLTVEEIRRVAVFADLAPDACERICRVAADITLAPRRREGFDERPANRRFSLSRA